MSSFVTESIVSAVVPAVAEFLCIQFRKFVIADGAIRTSNAELAFSPIWHFVVIVIYDLHVTYRQYHSDSANFPLLGREAVEGRIRGSFSRAEAFEDRHSEARFEVLHQAERQQL